MDTVATRQSTPLPTAALDLLAVGELFLDVLYGPLPSAPALGQEIFTDRVDLVPGGIANFALAAAALGARAGVSAHTGTGSAADLAATILTARGVDTRGLIAAPDHDLQITAALAYDGERALVTGGTAPHEQIQPDLETLSARAIAVHIGLADMPWLERAHNAGSRIFADVGWDPTEQWDRAILRHLSSCHGFLPNAVEAMAYTRTDTPLQAARELSTLVPLTVVTCGGDGVIGIDAASGTEITLPAQDLGPVDPTGAGDTFGAALITLLGRDLDLRDALEAAALAATGRAAAVHGPGRTPTLSQLTTLARTHGLACAEPLSALAKAASPSTSD